MIRKQLSQHIKELLSEERITPKDIAVLIDRTERRVQQKIKNNNWTLEDIEAIEGKLGERILYSAKDFFAKEEVKAVLHIELKNSQKEAILKQLIGKKDLEILNK